MEEAGISCNKPPKLFGLYHNTTSRPDDHVAFYIVKDFTQEKVESNEILKIKWFPLTKLPENISAGTKRRIEEYLGSKEVNEKW